MGTYVALVGTTGTLTGGGLMEDGTGSTPLTITDVLTILRANADSGGVGSYVRNLALAGAINMQISSSIGTFALDGTAPVTFNNLPAGFTVDSAAIKLYQSINPFPPPPAFPDFHIFSTFGVNSLVTPPGGLALLSASYPSVPTAIELYTDTISVSVSVADGISQTAFFYGFYVAGTYSINNYTFTLTNNSPVNAGDTITTTPSGANPIDPAQVTGITVTDNNGNVSHPAFTGTASSLTFVLSAFVGTPTVLTFSITSTQFSGSVTLGKLTTINFVNAPGIYKIVSGQTYDILYDVTNPGTTLDVKIPDPFWKTGYVGG